ncbi:hypothetical protein PROFUN_10463 [Planoprotostelium fungivorum]|uniref:Uncharacterized protein n=1 Tax=Planoprotostelium fungivorum TaxID=1890364 RepID=A0A2P6NDE1_9EUKA|nr:hypothetical protein PROFUN_10463 [Planoprotostelium fungivorum]
MEAEEGSPDFKEGSLWYNEIEAGNEGDLVSYMMHGADVSLPVSYINDKVTFEDTTPLHMVVYLSAHDMVETFLNGGAKMDSLSRLIVIKNENETTTLRDVSVMQLATVLDRKKVIEALTEFAPVDDEQWGAQGQVDRQAKE